MHRKVPSLTALVAVGIVAVLAVGLLAAALAGCARRSDGHGVATAGKVKPTASASAGASTSPADAAEQMRKFAQCMRAQGIDMPDPEVDGNGGIGFTIGGSDKADPQKVNAAMSKCKQYLPNGGEPPRLDPAQVEQMRQFAKCMREHGIADFPDPGDGGAIQIQGGGPGSDLDPNNPTFKAAQQACEKYAPSPGAGGGQRTDTNGGGK
jgi:hypothetical protein